jgi:transposase
MELVAKVSDLEQKIQSLETVVSSLTAQIAKQDALIKWYEEQFKLAQRRRFGSSSEQSPDQLRFDNLFNEAEEQADPSLPEPTFEEITYKRKKRVGKKKDDLSGLPVERIDYELPESERICPECGKIMDDIGVTIRDELEIVPAQVIHKEHATHAYGCADCGKNGGSKPIVRADSPMSLIAGSLASPSAVAYIASQKYVNGMPLYRTEKGFSFEGIVLSRQTMANWIVYCGLNYLKALYMLLIARLLSYCLTIAPIAIASIRSSLC